VYARMDASTIWGCSRRESSPPDGKGWLRYDWPMRLLMSVVLAMFVLDAGAVDRSRVVRAEFQRLNPCPANGATRGACPGFEADHIVALLRRAAPTTRATWNGARARDHASEVRRDAVALKRTAAKQ
jgi:hypothetical protein